MERLDGLVVDHFCGRVLEPSRLKTLLSELRNRAARQDDTSHRCLSALRRELRHLEAAQGNLLDAVERGLVGGDSNSFRARYNENEARREELIRLIASLDRELKAPLRQHLDDRKLGAFAAALRSRIESGDTALRKRYLRQFIDRIEVDNHEIRIRGPKSTCPEARRSASGALQTRCPVLPRSGVPQGIRAVRER